MTSIPAFDFDLYQSPEGLSQLDSRFLDFVAAVDPALSERFADYRHGVSNLDKTAESALLLETAPHLEAFLCGLFTIEAEHAALAAEIEAEQLIARFKKEVVQKKARRYRKPIEADFETLDDWLGNQMEPAPADAELAVARLAVPTSDRIALAIQ